jgi:pimeloyl-ACP methyl ester carboxylesterase
MTLAVNGARVFVATGGKAPNPDLPTLVFIHGSGMDRTVWTLQTRWFAHHGRSVLAIDLPGHGRSEGKPLDTIEQLADWLIALLDAAKVKQAALIGHSLGALVALEAAARAPQRVWALALLGVAAPMKVHPDLLRAARDGDHVAIDLVASWGFGRRAHLGGARAPGLWMLGGGARLLERDRAGALAAGLAACDAYRGALGAAKKVRGTTLVIAGAIDRMTPPAAAQPIVAAIDGARLVTIPEAGHMMMVEQPDATLEALKEVV